MNKQELITSLYKLRTAIWQSEITDIALIEKVIANMTEVIRTLETTT
ncbi:hypothetical protein KAR91_54830 [Candidatus Pacearchaeota archaeon]|nr:hypothetical protein [Candidatus Pacearchaeota archaeon]